MTDKLHQIHQAVQKAIDNGVIFGASYSLISQEEIEMRFEGVQGDDELNIALDPSMIYDLGGLTQSVATTTRIFQLLAIREIGFRDPVVKYLPGFSHAEINIWHLLSQQSGLPVQIPSASNMTGLEFVNVLYDIDLDFEPGDHVQHSPLNMILLGLIIRSTDGSIDRSVQDHILYPLAMTNTGYNLNRPKIRFVPTRKDAKRGQIQGQVEDYQGLILNGESGYSGLFSTLNDLTVFVEMMLQRGNYQGKEILDPQIFTLLQKFDEDGQSLGWRRSYSNKGLFYMQSPTGVIAFDIAKRQGLVCMTSFIEDEEDRKKLLNEILKVVE